MNYGDFLLMKEIRDNFWFAYIAFLIYLQFLIIWLAMLYRAVFLLPFLFVSSHNHYKKQSLAFNYIYICNVSKWSSGVCLGPWDPFKG